MASSAQAVSNTQEIVDASEILDKIARGEPVDYEGVIIEGNPLNLNGLDLPLIRGEGSKYEGEMIDFDVEARLVNSSIEIRIPEKESTLEAAYLRIAPILVGLSSVTIQISIEPVSTATLVSTVLSSMAKPISMEHVSGEMQDLNSPISKTIVASERPSSGMTSLSWELIF